MKLVMLHGRSQEDKDPDKLRHKWVSALREGAAKGGLELPIDEEDIVFPYFGDALRDLTSDEPVDQLSEVEIAVPHFDDLEFRCRVLNECLDGYGITEKIISDEVSEEVQRLGPLSRQWVQAGLALLDRHVPRASAAGLTWMAEDVAQYLHREDVRNYIDSGVAKAFQSCKGDDNIVVVGHSFGSIVAYRMLESAELISCPVNALITIGSPLGVTAIRTALQPVSYPSIVGAWFNAYDEQDAIALVPLDRKHMPRAQPIKNYSGVQNNSPNHHGIHGYLSDRVVATRIVQALRETGPATREARRPFRQRLSRRGAGPLSSRSRS